MKIPQCDREQEVLDALRSGRWASGWGEDIRKHAAECAVCAEVALVAQALQHEDELAQVDLQQTGVGLPPGLIWWKAQLAARRAAEQRAAQPIAWVERAALTLSALAVLGLTVWQLPHIGDWLRGAVSAMGMPGFAAAPEGASSGEWLHQLVQGLIPTWSSYAPAYLVAASAAAFLTLIAFAAYVVWREE